MPPEIPGVDVGAVVGRGGNATVYAGVQRAVQRAVAVKVDHRAITLERNQRRFVREATAAGRISGHPHVVSLIDAGTTDDHHPYLVMELCEGGSVADLLRRTGPLPVVDALDIAIAVTGALAAAHDAGILHRDVKPGNILIDAFGTPRLSDFGLAAQQVVDDEAFSATLEALTPAYAPPEVFERGVPTARSDVYSMGATLYAMLVGGTPRRRADGSSLSLTEIVAALPEPLPAPDRPGVETVMPVLWRATAYDAADRHASAVELREDLVRVRALLGPATGNVGGPEVTVVAPPLTGSDPALPPAPGVPEPTPRRRVAAILLATAALVVGAGVGAGATWAGMSSGATDALPPSPSSSGTSSDDAVNATDTPTGPGSPTDGSTSAETTAVAAPPAPVEGCWGGLVIISGNVSATPVPCSDPHRWETYAAGELDPATASAREEDAAADPSVTATCTPAALEAFLGAPVDVAAYNLAIVPPSEAAFYAGERAFSCVVTPIDGGERTGSLRG